MKKQGSILILLVFMLSGLTAQTGFLPLGELGYYYFERQVMLSGDSAAAYLGVYPLRSKAIGAAIEAIESNSIVNGQLDYLKVESDPLIGSSEITKREKPLLNYFYKNSGQFLSIRQPQIGLVLNPILYLKYSNKQDSGDPVFQNTRGVGISGHIDQKVYFQSQILESQSSFPDYVERRMTRDTFVQGNGFFKNYTSSVFNINSGYDYLNSTGRFGFNATPSIDISFGYDRNFIGSGFRSLFLSDFANNYTNLRINTKVWKITYQNIFAEFFNNGTFSSRTKTKERKYFSGHYLKFNFTPNFHIGFFEAVVYSGKLGLQPALLNPIIFYRSIEGFANQEGNAMIGADFRINCFKRFSLYGQLMLDEFKFDEVFGEPSGWWANKFGVQLGAKYFNVLGIKNLDGLLEYNVVRPYTYGHQSKITSYSNFNQPLAHPIGANFQEVTANAKYSLNNKWFVDATVIRMSFGEDSLGSHWGTNILLPYGEREMEYNNLISQGIDTDVWLVNLNLSYKLGHDIFIDLEYNLRKQMSDLESRRYNENYVGLSFRMNMARIKHNF